ncbi:MAG: dockerin type I domain-containing protein [Clostridia bacterium]|nr:dockerin type I domain-containing protein [Clostridia bacterium]
MNKKVFKNKAFIFLCVLLLTSSIFTSFAVGQGSTLPSTRTGGYDYTDNRAPSQNPPGGLAASQVPLFIVFGFDDNSNVEGMQWITNLFKSKKNPTGTGNSATYDGTTAKITFYHPSSFMNTNPSLKQAWQLAFEAGNEVGSHTNTHPSGGSYSVSQWQSEMTISVDSLSKPYSQGLGVPLSQIIGFRSPYLEYNENMPTAAKNTGFWYDCSIEEGSEPDQDGTNFFWPYTLDGGSPGNAASVAAGEPGIKPIGKYPGLWELPVYNVIVPPDNKCAQYGVAAGFRTSMKNKRPSIFNESAGKITGFDWNLWDDFSMTKEQFVATLKYSLDQRLQGNRAPMTFGAHSNYYNVAFKQQAMQEFIDYALTKPEVRIVSARQMLDWLRNPVPLNGGTTITPSPTNTPTPTPEQPNGYKISGYICPDFSFTASAAPSIKSGFMIECAGQVVYSDKNGYFELNSLVKNEAGYSIVIKKANYLRRTVTGIKGNSQIGTPVEPLDVWAGDINGDGAINMSDIVELITAYNTSAGDTNYKEGYDFDKDLAVNMSDIVIIIKHFNQTSENYLHPANIITQPTQSTATPTPTVTPTPTEKPQTTPAVEAWKTGVNYVKGQMVTYQSSTYKCNLDHLSQDGWDPSSVPALWTKV